MQRTKGSCFGYVPKCAELKHADILLSVGSMFNNLCFKIKSVLNDVAKTEPPLTSACKGEMFEMKYFKELSFHLQVSRS